MNLTDFDSADERYHTSNLYTSMEGTVLCSSLSSLSIVASLVTITIILRSYDGLTSVYHRFIFCTSFANFLFSLAMALNTLPMPKDMPYTQFEGLHIGNQSTCDAQGFISIFGFTADLSYFVGLLIYYLCSITFKMMDATFQKFVEPLFHALAISLSIFVPSLALVRESINPSIHKNWCARETLPFWCDGDDEKSYDKNYTVCIRGDPKLEQIMVDRWNVFSAFVVVVVFISMIMIILSVYQSERSVPLDPTTTSSNPRTMGANATKVVLVQISAYLFSIILVSICSYLSVSYREISSLSMQYFYIIVGSTRGILNFIIFIGHKVYNLQRVNESLSLRDIIWKVLYSRNENVFVFDNIPSSLQLPETSDLSNKDRSEKSSNDRSQSFCSDPTKAAHPITMFHLNQVADADISLPSKDEILSADDDDLPSKNDMSSSIGSSLSDRQSLDLSSNIWKYA